MTDVIYCGQCSIANPVTNKFCGQCGTALVNASNVPIEYEYRDFEWRVSVNDSRDCVLAREGLQTTSDSHYPMSETEAREHFWHKYQKVILNDFHEWLDAGWQPITEVGAACVEIESDTQGQPSGFRHWLKGLVYPEWCFAGATIKVRRPKSQ